jgi:hypothetical protein
MTTGTPIEVFWEELNKWDDKLDLAVKKALQQHAIRIFDDIKLCNYGDGIIRISPKIFNKLKNKWCK